MNKAERDFQNALLTAPMSREETAAIQAVEGLALSPEILRVFKKADADGVHGQERRQRIAQALGVKLG